MSDLKSGTSVVESERQDTRTQYISGSLENLNPRCKRTENMDSWNERSSNLDPWRGELANSDSWREVSANQDPCLEGSFNPDPWQSSPGEFVEGNILSQLAAMTPPPLRGFKKKKGPPRRAVYFTNNLGKEKYMPFYNF